ncbi:protein-glutamate O-methyltransferase CheR [Candidatus Poribacteria bacterium]|nr:protein-glutamate O-methyltransferase CheR [Candidatus Poribacteria bacterium]
MNNADIENIEISLLLEAIYERYGHDFRHYARASISRRIRQFLNNASGCASISEMIPKVLHDESFFERLINNFSIPVTEMFRDPLVYRSIRQKIVPLLKTYPFVRIWHAGCATGEEVYSMAILLKEEGLYDRATIFATDFNDVALSKAKEGIYAVDSIKQFTGNYQQSGGSASFSEYYHARYDSIAIQHSLKRNITFANHNLATDGVFGEMHLIMCRNVLIYLDSALQSRVANLFGESLTYGGFLCLGTKETLDFTDGGKHFKVIDEPARIYQKKAAGFAP